MKVLFSQGELCCRTISSRILENETWFGRIDYFAGRELASEVERNEKKERTTTMESFVGFGNIFIQLTFCFVNVNVVHVIHCRSTGK
jgi:hypothetical protein